MSTVVATTPSLAVQSALVAAVEALDAADRPVGRSSITVGVTPWDDCCATGGECYARIDRLYRSDRFPAEGSLQACVAPTAALVVVGVARCYPTLDEGGNPPDPIQETNASLLLYEDALIIWQALQAPGWWPDAVLVNDQQFLALGGCCAFETQVFVQLV